MTEIVGAGFREDNLNLKSGICPAAYLVCRATRGFNVF